MTSERHANVDKPNLVLRNARLVGSGGRRCDIRVVGDRIVALGDHDEGLTAHVAATDTRAAQILDLDGRWVMRGLRDHHVHMSQWAMALHRFDASGARSDLDLARLARSACAGQPGDDVVIGFGFRDALWIDKASRATLDEYTGTRPVAIIAADLHSVLANTAALEHFGVRRRPRGVLREKDTFAFLRQLRDAPDDVLDTWVEEAARQAAARGVTSIIDMEMQWGVPVWQRRFANGFAGLAVGVSSYSQDLWRVKEGGWYSGSALAPELALGAEGGDAAVNSTLPLLTFGPLKCIVDGSLTTRTAYCSQPYGSPLGDGRGQLTIDQGALEGALREAAALNIRAAVHAIGDAAVGTVLAAFANTGAVGSIEHAQLLQLDEAPDFTALGIAASVQPMHLLDDRAAVEEYWGDRADGAYAFATLDNAGAELWFGSDAPVAPLDPWGAISAAVLRADVDAAGPWHPEQQLSRDSALRAACGRPRDALGTRDWALNAGQCDYRVRAGVVADLCILDADPLAVEAAALATMPVAGTLLGGRWSFKTW